MLTQLYIQNIAVIEKTSINFQPGFNIFTGETGAGKSILIDAISAVLGFRTSRELIRTGANKAVVTALFDHLSAETMQSLENFGYEAEEDGTLLLTRELLSDGKTTCKLNGRPATVSILREVAQTLINIHGQHDNQALMSPEQHIRFVDSFAASEQLLAEYQKQYKTLLDIRKELEKLNMDESEKAYRMDLLRYQIEEISAANLNLGEEEELSVQKKRIANSAKIMENIVLANDALNGTEEQQGAVSQLGDAMQAFAVVSRYIPELENASTRLQDMYYELREYASDIGTYTADAEENGGNIDEIESRLDVIYRLKQKYGATAADVLAFLAQAQQELNTIACAEELQEKLRKQLAQATYAAQKCAETLSQKRQQAGDEFTKAVGEELRFLDMPFVRLGIHNEIGALSSNGIDNLEFLISTNPGEPMKPLSKIASGGELSRIMLSLKNVLADRDHVSTLIFDEVDSGVSGRAAQKIGQKLKQASTGRQIICVTHLAQVAVYANGHFLIEKNVRDQRTYTAVRELTGDERVQEIARIIGGADITPAVLQNALEMLERATLPTGATANACANNS